MIVPKSKLPHKELREIVCYLGSGISRPFKNDSIGLPVLRSNNVSDGKVNRDNLKYWFKVDPRGADLCKVKPCKGDILVNFVNGSRKELGKAGLFLGVPKNCIVSTNFFIVRLDKSIAYPYFINFFFQSEEYRKWLYQITYFSGQGSFNQQEFRSLNIPVPPLPKQKKIAEILGKWDDGIETVEKLIAAKRKMKKALMQQLLTGKNRFKEFKGQKWKAWEFGNFVHLSKEKHDPKKERLSVKCIELEHIKQEDGQLVGNTESNKQACVKNVFQREDVLFGKLRPYLKKFYLAQFDGVCSTEIWVLRARKEACHYWFLFYLIQTSDFIQAANVTSGTKMPRSDWNYVSEIPFSLPSVKEQQKIASVLNTADKEIELLNNNLEALKNQKKGLMQKLLTGKIRVKV